MTVATLGYKLEALARAGETLELTLRESTADDHAEIIQMLKDNCRYLLRKLRLWSPDFAIAVPEQSFSGEIDMSETEEINATAEADVWIYSGTNPVAKGFVEMEGKTIDDDVIEWRLITVSLEAVK